MQRKEKAAFEHIDLEMQRRLIGNKMALSREEYSALQVLFASIMAYRETLCKMEHRLKETVPGGWRDARMLASVAETLYHKILLTIPREKLMRMEKEMGHLVMEVKMENPFPHKHDEDYQMVQEKYLTTLSRMACANNCELCGKRDGQVRGCPLREALSRTLEFNTPKVLEDGSCIFQSYEIDLQGGNSMEKRWLADMRGYEVDEDGSEDNLVLDV